MEWEQKTNWYMQSDEGYRISIATSKCPGQYTAWAPSSKTESPALAYKPTLEEAKNVCEEHLTQILNKSIHSTLTNSYRQTT